MDQTINYSLSKIPLEDLMKKNNYYPDTYSYPNDNDTNIQIPTNQLFHTIFPTLFIFIQNSDNELATYLKKTTNYSNTELDLSAREFMRNTITKYEKEITQFTGNDWTNLREKTKVHTTLFFALGSIEMPKHFNQYNQNILYWTILFHDIGKHQILNSNYNEIFNDQCVDKMHPFKSVYIFLKTFLENNYIYFSSFQEEEKKEKEIFVFKYEQFINVLLKSYTKKLKGKHISPSYNLSYEYINDIKSFLLFLREKPQNSWIYDITVLILFHQSLPNNDNKMNNPLLDEKYIMLFFDLRLIEMMRFIMVYDSSSHSLFKGGKWVQEINKHITQLRLLFK